MCLRTHYLLVIGLLVGIASLCYGLNYQYFSEYDETNLGDRASYFWHGDTLHGPVRSNDQLSIMQDPLFHDWVLSSAGSFHYVMGSPIPQFLGSDPLFNIDSLHLPSRIEWVRELAQLSGWYIAGSESANARVQFRGDSLRLWWMTPGVPLDTTDYTDLALPDSVVMFFDNSMRIFGTVSGIVILGSSGRISLEDNLIYESANPLNGIAPAGHAEKLAVIAEGEIKILNTVANGRENSGGHGFNWHDHNVSHIVLDGIYVALGESFTFENQNDPDSGYVYPNQPDDRGFIYLYGSLYQKRIGYTHRTTRSSTGYRKRHFYDPDLKFWNLPLFNVRENVAEPASLEFGEIRVGENRQLEVAIVNDYVPLTLGSVTTASPFAAVAGGSEPDFQRALSVTFAPVQPGEFFDTLRVELPYYGQTLKVPLHGIATELSADNPSLPLDFACSASPNPFNPQTSIAFTLPNEEWVKLEIFDITGRRVASLMDGRMSVGDHSLRFDGSPLAAGLYFARLEAGPNQRVIKLALVK